MDFFVAMSETGQVAIVILAFVVILVVLWGLLALLSWAVGKLGLFKRARRRFDALDDAVEEDLSKDDAFRLEVELQERMRGHDPSTR